MIDYSKRGKKGAGSTSRSTQAAQRAQTHSLTEGKETLIFGNVISLRFTETLEQAGAWQLAAGGPCRAAPAEAASPLPSAGAAAAGAASDFDFPPGSPRICIWANLFSGITDFRICVIPRASEISIPASYSSL